MDAVTKDVELAALPIFATFFKNLATNPTALNAAGQAAKLVVDLQAAAPMVAQQVVGDLNTSIQAAIAKRLAELNAQP